MDFDYFYNREAERFNFLNVPEILVDGEEFKGLSAVLPPLVNLVGECLPQTLLMRPVGRERRSTLEEKIQHAPPLPCGQNPHDRGRIRRLYRAAETL